MLKLKKLVLATLLVTTVYCLLIVCEYGVLLLAINIPERLATALYLLRLFLTKYKTRQETRHFRQNLDTNREDRYKEVIRYFLQSHDIMASRFVTKNNVLFLYGIRRFSLNVAFVSNYSHDTSAAGWRLIIFLVAWRLSSPRGKHPTPRRGALYVCVYL